MVPSKRQVLSSANAY